MVALYYVALAKEEYIDMLIRRELNKRQRASGKLQFAFAKAMADRQ